MNAAEHPGPLEPYVDAAMAGQVRAAVRPGAELCIIVPTFNERDNVAELIARLKSCLENRSWEVMFVDDDSPDGTAELIRELAAAARHPSVPAGAGARVAGAPGTTEREGL